MNKYFPFLFKATPPPWPWPSCGAAPRTLSFRLNDTANSASYHGGEDDQIEMFSEVEMAVVRGMRSERLVFEPGERNSVLAEAKAVETMAVESSDPVADFRASMEEMVAVHGHGVEFMEDLLECYLKLNHPANHRYIIQAFLDLIFPLSSSANASDDRSRSSLSSSSSDRQFSLSFSSSSTTATATPSSPPSS